MDATRSSLGRCASLVTTVRWQADRELATQLLPAEILGRIFRCTRSVMLRVK